MTQNDNGRGLGQNYGENAVFMFSRTEFFFAKNAFYHKKTPEISQETDIYFGKGYFFRSWPKHGYD